MKKLTVLSAILALSLYACGGEEPQPNPEPTSDDIIQPDFDEQSNNPNAPECKLDPTKIKVFYGPAQWNNQRYTFSIRGEKGAADAYLKLKVIYKNSASIHYEDISLSDGSFTLSLDLPVGEKVVPPVTVSFFAAYSSEISCCDGQCTLPHPSNYPGYLCPSGLWEPMQAQPCTMKMIVLTAISSATLPQEQVCVFGRCY